MVYVIGEGGKGGYVATFVGHEKGLGATEGITGDSTCELQ